jgi:phage gpG-like protein
MNFTLSITGEQELLDGLNALIQLPYEYEEFVKDDLLESLRSQTLRTFASQQDPYGNAWAPLSPYTLKHKKTNRIMYETGNLMRSLTIDKNDLSLSFNISYALKHQTGEPEKNLPQRLLLPIESQGLPSTWESDIDDLTNAFLENFL